MDKILIILGTTKTIMPYAKDYLHVLLFGIVFQMFTMSSNSVIRSQGDAKTAMIVMLIGAIVNLILDPIFIFVLDLGIKGAALATITSQFLTFLFTLHYFFSKKSILKIVIKDLILDIKIIKESLAIGISSFARQGSMSLLGILMNNSLKFYGGDLVIAAFGIVYKLMMFLIMPSLGILQGMQPIIGYNYGAKKYKRVKETFYLSVKTSTTIITCFYLFAMFFPELLIRLFTNDEGLILIAKQAFKIIILFFPIVAYQFIASGYFQAIGNAKKAFFLSLLRQLILLIPLIIVLPLFLGLKGIWYSYPIADFFALIITCVITNKEISKLDN